MKRTSRIRTEMGSAPKNKPFQNSVVAVIVDRCEKLTHEIQKNNIKSAALLVANLNKDISLLHHTHPSYNRLHSLSYNTQAAYYRKIGDCEEALKLIDQAIAVEKSGNVDAIDMARTLLNKSVIMGQMARNGTFCKNDGLNVRKSMNISGVNFPKYSSLAIIDQNIGENSEKAELNGINNLYSHEAAISLAKEALQLIKNRPEGRQLVQKDQYKLGELIIISFHNIATEMIFLNNEKEAYSLYKKAHQIALRLMGPRHNLTQHLKNILNKSKQEKRNSLNKNQQKIMSKTKKKNHFRRILTEENSMTQIFNLQEGQQEDVRSMPKKIPPIRAHGHRESGKKCTLNMSASMRKTSKDKKVKSYLKTYGGGDEKLHVKEQAVQMKELQKLQKIYKPSLTQNKYLPHIKRKNIKQIITEKPKKPMYFQNADRRKNIISSTQVIEPGAIKTMKKMKNTKSSQKIPLLEKKQDEQIKNEQMERKVQTIEPQLRHTEAIEQDKGCQLI